MQHLLILGAGRSAACLIDYLLAAAAERSWTVTVADRTTELAAAAVDGHPAALAVALDVTDTAACRALVAVADAVVSLLPPALHLTVANHCLATGAHLLTASYVTPELRARDAVARDKGLIFLNECGLDPGLDHLSAAQMLARERAAGGEVTAFRSYCGGLVAPAAEAGPWRYKLTWNPRNVVLAGSGGPARYREGGRLRYVPYHRLFARTTAVEVPGYGTFEAYPNRDSLGYEASFGLEGATTLVRGTLRRPGFCRGWEAVVRLGLTDDTAPVADSEQLTYADWVRRYLPTVATDLPAAVSDLLGLDEVTTEKLRWLGLFDDEPIGLPGATSAQILQHRLEARWRLQPTDRDMIVMQHQLEVRRPGRNYRLLASLVVEGTARRTAMAQTVGLPLAIATKLIMTGAVTTPGMQIPTDKVWYEPILAELNGHGISFQEEEVELPSETVS